MVIKNNKYQYHQKHYKNTEKKIRLLFSDAEKKRFKSSTHTHDDDDGPNKI